MVKTGPNDNKSPNFIQKVVNKLHWTFFRQEGKTKLNDRIKVYIISYPKSGRTWLRMLLGKALCEQFSLDEKDLLNTKKLTEAAGIPLVTWIHDGSGIGGGPHFIRFVTDKSIFRDKKVIFLYRDPKDVMVSSYFQATKRIPEFTHYTGTISEFVRSRGYGIKKLVTFYNLWHKNKNVPEDFLLIKYEDMHADTQKTLRLALEFIGVNDIKAELLESAVNYASFSNMKKMEQGKEFSSKIMQSGNQEDSESYKVRKGQVGGYVDYLSPEDIAYIDKAIAKMGCPFCGVSKN